MPDLPVKHDRLRLADAIVHKVAYFPKKLAESSESLNVRYWSLARKDVAVQHSEAQIEFWTQKLLDSVLLCLWRLVSVSDSRNYSNSNFFG